MSCIGECVELTLGNPYHTQMHFTPNDQFVWLMFAVCTVLKHGTQVHGTIAHAQAQAW